MAMARSRITSQGQISIPSSIRKKLGVEPGATVEWDQQGEDIVVRRAGRYTIGDIHKAVFPKGRPKRRTLAEMKDSIRRYTKGRDARG
jgi:AbrB family looped-hinge helix DNA binding protein